MALIHGVCSNSAHASTTLSVCHSSKKEAISSDAKIDTMKKAKRSRPKDDCRVFVLQPSEAGCTAANEVIAKKRNAQ